MSKRNDNILTVKRNIGIQKFGNTYDLDFHLNQYRNTLNLDEKIGVVYTCKKILSENLSKLPFSIFKTENGGKVEDVNHILFKTFLQPTSYLNLQTWLSTSTYILYSEGNSFAFIDRQFKNGKLTSVELPIVQAGYISDARIINGKLWYYSKSDNKAWRAEDLLHFKLMSENGIWGINPIEAMRLSLSLNVKAEKTVDKFYENNAQTAKYLEYGGSKIENIKEAVEAFEKENAGVMNAGKIPILPPNATLKTLPLSIEDAKFLDTAIYSEKSIAAMFGLSAHLLNHSEGKFSNFQESALWFKNNTMSALINIFETEMEFKLLTIEERMQKMNICADLEKLIDASLIEKANYFKILKDASIISPNEAARRLSLPAVESEYGDFHYTQLQYIPLEKYSEYANKVPVSITNVEDSGMKNNNEEK